MKNKILFVLVIIGLLSPTFGATEVSSVPKWIDVDYADLEHEYVSEYQLVNVTVTQKGNWWRNYNSEVNIDYDQNALELANVVYYDSQLNSTASLISDVTTSDSSFKVTYQFYLKPSFDQSQTTINVHKKINDKLEDGTVSINTHSDNIMENVRIGDLVIGYSVDQYQNDSESITYNGHFKVVSNSSNSPFTLTLKENNMSVESLDNYEAKLRYSSGSVEAIDKNNFSINIPEGDTFDLNITAEIEGLTAKDDRFEFLIYLSDGDNFKRLEPTFFRSELISTTVNTRASRFIMIKIIIAVFFALLAVMHVVSTKQKKNKQKPKS